MPLNVDGDPGYGSVVAGPGLTGSLGGSETVPLLIPEPEPFRWQPLTKEQLEREAGGPGWRTLRSRLLLFFWLGWLALLGASVAIIVQSPRPVAPVLLWWQKALFYRLQPALLMDADAEGAGLSVVSERLSYLQTLGVGAVVLEGLFSKMSPPPDLSGVDHSVGTTLQVEHLLMESRKAGLKVVLDFCDLDLSGSGNDTVQNAIRYWLDQGVAGFGICDTDKAYSEKTLMDWRVLLMEVSSQDEERIVVVRHTGEMLNPSSSSLNSSLVELVTRSLLPHRHHLLSTQEVAVAVETQLNSPAGDTWPSWTVGDEASWELHRVLLVLMMTLPGSPVVKYGEEITLTQNASLHKDSVQDDLDGEKRQRSAVALFTSLSKSRSREEALLYGSFTFLPFHNTTTSTNSSLSTPILGFLRSWGCVHVLVLVNLGPEPLAVDPAWTPQLPSAGVFITSSGMDRLGATSIDDLTLQPQEAVVIKLFQTESYSS